MSDPDDKPGAPHPDDPSATGRPQGDTSPGESAPPRRRDHYSGDIDQLLDDPPPEDDQLPAPRRSNHRGGVDQLLDDPPEDDPLPAAKPRRDNHSGDIDQLLSDPPETDYHRGRFAGYQAGSRVRKFVFIALVLASIGAVIAGYWYITYLHANRTPLHAVPLPEGTDISKRSRTMTWSSGKARLGLTREPPGLLAIELPDRTLTLAPDCDSAQVRLDVVDGKTVQLLVLFGDIIESPPATATQ